MSHTNVLIRAQRTALLQSRLSSDFTPNALWKARNGTKSFTTSSCFFSSTNGTTMSSSLLTKKVYQTKNTITTNLIPMSYFSSTTTTKKEENSNKNVNVLADLLQKQQFQTIAATLENDPRVKIPVSEYYQLCEKNGVNEQEAKNLLEAFHDTGKYLHYKENPELKGHVLLKPNDLASSLMRLFDTNDELSHTFVEEEKQQMEVVTKELAEMEKMNEALERKAYARADKIIYLGFAFLAAQGAAVARLTWWELSWDIMEPVTYMLTFTTILGTMGYFALTKTEYTYEALRNRLAAKRLKKLQKRANFDTARFEELKEKIVDLQLSVENPDMSLLYSSDFLKKKF